VGRYRTVALSILAIALTTLFANQVSAAWWSCTGSAGTPLATQQINDGAILQLRMNDPASPCTSLADTSGQGHNATVHGGVTCGATGGGQDGATAITFNGTTGYLTVSPATQAYPFTLEFAVNYSTINTGGIWDMNPGVGGTRDFNCNVGTVNNSNVADIGVNTTCYASYSTGQWIFVDVVYGASVQTVYVNGTLASQGTTTAGTYAQGASIGIGSLNTGGANFLAGSLQDFAIYPTALSQTRIQKHTSAYFGS
jgi:Concanavalin A-like lectin/glucanases superfamily